MVGVDITAREERRVVVGERKMEYHVQESRHVTHAAKYRRGAVSKVKIGTGAGVYDWVQTMLVFYIVRTGKPCHYTT